MLIAALGGSGNDVVSRNPDQPKWQDGLAACDVVVADVLAAADLPVIVWCRSRRVLESSQFTRLEELARKVVADTIAWPDPKAALERLANRWTVLITCVLEGGPTRFNDLKSQLGVSAQVLTRILRNLERDGLVTRQVYAEVPVRVEYALTPFGHSLYAALAPLCEWGTLHMKRIETRKEAAEAKTRQESARMMRA